MVYDHMLLLFDLRKLYVIVLPTKTLDTCWLTTQGVNIISTAYPQTFQSVIKALQPLEVQLF